MIFRNGIGFDIAVVDASEKEIIDSETLQLVTGDDCRIRNWPAFTRDATDEGEFEIPINVARLNYVTQ